jgi:hypothetical protein
MKLSQRRGLGRKKKSVADNYICIDTDIDIAHPHTSTYIHKDYRMNQYKQIEQNNYNTDICHIWNYSLHPFQLDPDDDIP